ncbi:MAG TPA: 50S ribosomal protein L20 [Patescibacteria group bacterium]
MARVKRGTVSKRKHNKLLASTKGFRGTKNRLVRKAKESALHAGQYAFNGRKLRKQDFRSLWITRISETVKLENISYSVFIDKLKKANITLDRKILSNLIVEDAATFKHIVDMVKKI